MFGFEVTARRVRARVRTAGLAFIAVTAVLALTAVVASAAPTAAAKVKRPTVTVTASPAGSATAGQPVTLTVAVAPRTARGVVLVYDGTDLLAWRLRSTPGPVTVRTSALAPGTHHLSAAFRTLIGRTVRSPVLTYRITAIAPLSVDPQNIVVRVPKHPMPTPSRPSKRAAPRPRARVLGESQDRGGLAYTGADIVRLLLLAGVLGAAGTALHASASHRRRRWATAVVWTGAAALVLGVVASVPYLVRGDSAFGATAGSAGVSAPTAAPPSRPVLDTGGRIPTVAIVSVAGSPITAAAPARAGSTVVVRAGGYDPGELTSVVLDGVPRADLRAVAGSDGTVELVLAAPAAGVHEVSLTGATLRVAGVLYVGPRE